MTGAQRPRAMRRTLCLCVLCLCYRVSIGAIAQLGERVLCKHEVVGSIPSGSTIALRCGSRYGSPSGEHFGSSRNGLAAGPCDRCALIF